MEEYALPTIKDMYNCTRQNHDYNVIRCYQPSNKNFAVNAKPTKKDHYLDEAIRLNCSPGPASSANRQVPWFNKNQFQSRRSEKQTYLDEICKRVKKNNSPSPNHYGISMEWPKKRDQLKNVSEKTNFADTCQYQSDMIPGPGNYNIIKHLGTKGQNKKIQPHHPIQPREVAAAEVGTYSPCTLEYNTFDRYLLKKSSSQPMIAKVEKKGNKSSKENKSPGPAAYSTVSHWPGKSPSKAKQVNYFKCLSKKPSSGVYH